MYWPKQAQLGLTDKGRVIKEFWVFDHIIMHISKQDLVQR